MVEKQLTKSQIQHLFDFTRQHRVRHLDVQIELIDHLASAIESRWAENPNWSFERILETVHNDFGIYGFGKLEMEKQRVIEEKMGRSIWKFVKSYFTIPRLLATVAIIYGTYQIMLASPNPGLIGKIFFFTQFVVVAGVLCWFTWGKKKLMHTYLEVRTVISIATTVLYFTSFMIYHLIIDDTFHADFLPFLSFWMIFSIILLVGTLQYTFQAVEKVKQQYAAMG